MKTKLVTGVAIVLGSGGLLYSVMKTRPAIPPAAAAAPAPARRSPPKILRPNSTVNTARATWPEGNVLIVLS